MSIMLKKLFSLAFILLALFVVYSCTEGGNSLIIKISPSDKSLIELVSETYDETQLMDIVSFDGSLNDLNTKYPIECLRDYNGMYYRVAYLGNDSIAILTFDRSYNKLFGRIYSASLSKTDFDKLTKGMSLDEVRSIDTNGEYLFLYTGRNDLNESFHCTKDGYFYAIEYVYDESMKSWIVSEIKIELI